MPLMAITQSATPHNSLYFRMCCVRMVSSPIRFACYEMHRQRATGSTRGQRPSAALVTGVFGSVAESEHVEQIADRRTVHRHVGIVLIGAGVWQIVAAAPGERGEVPVALDEFQDRDMVVIAVYN